MLDTRSRKFAAWQFAVALALASMASTGVDKAQAVELIPSIGVTKSTDDNAGDAQGFGGLALRASLNSFLKVEGGVGYRQDSFMNDDLKVHQWPVTASLWASPFSALYLGGGLGWYHTTYEYEGALDITDETSSDIGIHLGGGLNLPLSPKLGLDLNGRYIFMQEDDDNIQFPTTFDPGFWSTSLGLAIKF